MDSIIQIHNNNNNNSSKQRHRNDVHLYVDFAAKHFLSILVSIDKRAQLP